MTWRANPAKEVIVEDGDRECGVTARRAYYLSLFEIS